MGEARVAGELDDPDLAVRVGTEMLGEIVQRGPDAADHAIQVEDVAGVVEDLDADVVPPSFTHRVVGRED